ncbi:diacylglycerol kinase [uncultured Clostridium sp.]|uniref:diacylglycerol kinase n=1 Tax=uncultured Clostridium sp. TaxID=59620 RepID=UPI0025E190B0|nr:diacylglycerol kinase [uncultured Clostridium sp.]
MKLKNLVDSFNHAITGIIEAVRSEKNMKIHLVVSLVVLIGCFCFNISKLEFLLLAITITMVISAELVNTAIENVVDMTANYYHPLAKLAKNVAAGAVLVTAINAIIVGYIVFWDKLSDISYEVINKLKRSEPYTIFIVIVIVCILTIIFKAILGEGTPFQGGMPSGHSALSFSIATAIALITEEPICIVLSYLMALITAQSRIDTKVHSFFEVLVGALLGILITLLIFTIFKI